VNAWKILPKLVFGRRTAPHSGVVEGKFDVAPLPLHRLRRSPSPNKFGEDLELITQRHSPRG